MWMRIWNAVVYQLKMRQVAILGNDFREVAARRRGMRWVRFFAMSRSMPIPFKKGILFIHVPRNGGTSVFQSLYGRKSAHLSALCYKELMPTEFKRFISFALFRDPFDRFLSVYFFVMNGGGTDVKLSPKWIRLTENVRNVDDFLRFLIANSKDLDRLDYVMRPQAYFIVDRNNNVIVDELFLFGRDEAEMKKLIACHVPDFNGKIDHLNATRRQDILLTSKQRDTIRILYKNDFAIYERLLTRNFLKADA